MKPGDIVRFAKWQEVDISDSKTWHMQPKPHVGILIKHDKLMQVAEILCEGEVFRVRHQFAEKAGKGDIKSESR